MRFVRSALLAAILLTGIPAASATEPLAEDHYTAVSDAGDPPATPRATVTYRAGSLGAVGNDLADFRRGVQTTLNDPRGWSLEGAVRFVTTRGDADFRIWLASPAEVAAAHPTCDALFSCRVGPDVYINVARWRHGATGEWDASLSQYRRYVVNHEVGHWLGLDHADCPAAGASAPVMLQQTIGLHGCTAQIWPLPRELRRVQEHIAALGR